MNIAHQFHVAAGHEGERLDVFLTTSLGLSRARVQAGIDAGNVTINNDVIRKSAYRLGLGEHIQYTVVEKPQEVIQEPDIPILYQNDDVIVINKPAGLVVYPPNERPQPSVATALAHLIASDVERDGIVHRLDKETSGVMILARTVFARTWLIEQFKQRKVTKHYSALACGHMEHAEARVELPLRKDRRIGTKMVVASSGKPAIMTYKVVRELEHYSLLNINLLTGRTHQIRVQLSYLGNPVAGDVLYGKPERPKGLLRQFLHAESLSLTLPNGQVQSFQADLPPDLAEFLTTLE